MYAFCRCPGISVVRASFTYYTLMCEYVFVYSFHLECDGEGGTTERLLQEDL